MHARSRMTIGPRIPAMPTRGASGFHRPGEGGFAFVCTLLPYLAFKRGSCWFFVIHDCCDTVCVFFFVARCMCYSVSLFVFMSCTQQTDRATGCHPICVSIDNNSSISPVSYLQNGCQRWIYLAQSIGVDTAWLSIDTSRYLLWSII